ncbi:MAG: DUF3086 domain-containing protein [Cyanobacteria bacterium P01_F01_bin.150]
MTMEPGDEALRQGQRVDEMTQRVAMLQRQEQTLQRAVAQLQQRYDQLLQTQSEDSKVILSRLVDETMMELSQRRQALQLEVEKLEKQRDRIQAEMRSSFSGVSQDLAVRVQGFKDYLVGSLQDLATAAEQLPVQSPRNPPVASPSPVPLDLGVQGLSPSPKDFQRSAPGPTQDLNVSIRGFAQDEKQIRQILDQYRHSPDYYGTPWQLRRTFEPIHAKRVSQWFFDQGGRGSVKTMGSRLQNILVASAIISVLRMMKGDRVRILILSDSPGRLGEWRRGFQDCLGISRTDFGAQQGVALFEAPEAICQRADRLLEQGNQPLILIDNSEDKVHLSLLQYPLWLAFAPDIRGMPI